MNGWDDALLTDAIANCLVNNTSGVVESCSSFSTTNSPTASRACTERSPAYPCEKVHGILTSLPGCTTSGGVATCPGGVQPACSPDFSTTGLVVSPGNEDYSSIGCFTEATSGRALSVNSYTDPAGMTVDTCLAFCSGYVYAGVEYGQEVCIRPQTPLAHIILTTASLVLLCQCFFSRYFARPYRRL